MLGAKEIKEILPHRYPFLMIDRVEEVEEGKRAKGFKNISVNEEFFNGHFPDYPCSIDALNILSWLDKE